MGYTRFNIPYYYNDEEVEFVLKAMEFAAKYGWMFLPAYKFDLDTAKWTHRADSEQKIRYWLGEIDYTSGTFDSKIIANREHMPFTTNKHTVPDYELLLE